MCILVTGGAGFIGSHTIVELLQSGLDVLVLDNFSNSNVVSLQRVQQITGLEVNFVQGDVRDESLLNRLFRENNIDSVIHFAGLKAVGESCEKPLEYYNNVAGTISLCQVMAKFNCKKMVFSSSATVYGEPKSLPITEDFPLSTTNPYGASKLMVEEILRDLHLSDPSWDIAILRYFNPVGAHPTGLIVEDPKDIPNNLMPFITQVAVGKRGHLSVFGDDYDTVDGSGVRDYIHVVDLAKARLKAMHKLQQNPGCQAYNLGTGMGISVLQMLAAFERFSGKAIAHKIMPRRSGDIASCYAQTQFAESELSWKAQLDLSDMVKDAWNWQIKNPQGYTE